MIDAWRHLFARFGGFIVHLRPSQSERCDALTAAAAGVARRLRCHFHPLDELLSGGLPGVGESDHLITGGHGKGTATRPVDAVDVLCVLPANLQLENRPATGGRALGLEMSAVLRKRFSDITQAPEGWLAVKHGEGVPRHEPAVRLIPCFPRRPAEERHALQSADPGSATAWRSIDPAVEIACLQATDAASRNTARHLILMLKAWRKAGHIDIAALALGLRVTNFVSIWTYYCRSLLFCDGMVREFFFWLHSQRDRAVPIPGGPESLSVGGSWLSSANDA
jgi:hypothetical protein